MFIKVSLLYIELYDKNLKYDKITYHSVRVMSMRHNMYKHKIQVKDPMTKKTLVSMEPPVNI